MAASPSGNLWQHLDAIIARNCDEQIDLLQRMVRTRSTNPFTPDTSAPDAPVEREMALLIANALRRLNLEPQLVGASDQRPNVVATLPAQSPNRPAGKPAPRALILNGHMDTVMPGDRWQSDPFGAAIRGGRLVGLGALDMKASLTAMIFAARALLEGGVALDGDLILTFAIDEEPGGCSPYGTAYVLDRAGLVLGPEVAAIVTEPEYDNITIGHRGGYRFKLTVHGEAAHTGLTAWERGEAGRNAITEMARAITAVQDVPIPFEETPAFPNRQPVFTFPTMIQGGSGINVVPDACTAYGDTRLLPGADAATVERLLRARLDALPGLKYTLDNLLAVPAVTIPHHHALVESLARQTAAITGLTPTRLGCGPWNDGWMFITRGIPAVCGFGPSGANMHAPEEYVELDSVLTVTRILTRAAIDWLGLATP